MSTSTITLKEIKATRKLTLSQKAVLGEIHSLVSRGKEFYAWNSYLSEKLGIARSTAANAMTYFYKNGVLLSKCEHNDGKTARVTKRTIDINYKKLAAFLDVPIKPQAHAKQPLHAPSKETPVFIAQKFEDIDFETSEKEIIKQWTNYMISHLDRETGIANPITREKNALKGILEDARRVIDSSFKQGGKACSAVSLIKDRRIEMAIGYCLRRIILDERDGIYGGYEEYGSKIVEKSDLNYSWMRNIYKPWPEILATAISSHTFDPIRYAEDDILHDFHYSTGVPYSEIKPIKEGESLEDYHARMRELGYVPNDYDEWDFLKEEVELPDTEIPLEKQEELLKSLKQKGIIDDYVYKERNYPQETQSNAQQGQIINWNLI